MKLIRIHFLTLVYNKLFQIKRVMIKNLFLHKLLFEIIRLQPQMKLVNILTYSKRIILIDLNIVLVGIIHCSNRINTFLKHLVNQIHFLICIFRISLVIKSLISTILDNFFSKICFKQSSYFLLIT